MAINVNTVYTTVLSILNKEQRGYITPDEFNKLATQVQLDIFENYFEDMNQQLRIPQTDNEYANRQKNVDNLISIFKSIGNTTTVPAGSVISITLVDGGTGYSAATNVPTTTTGNGSGLTVDIISLDEGLIQSVIINNPGSGYSNGDTVTITGGDANATLTISFVNSQLYFLPPPSTHRIGTVIYKDEKELQRVDRNDFLHINLSPLTKPTTSHPIYIYEQATQAVTGTQTGQPHIYVYPSTITNASDIKVSYIRKPVDHKWAFRVNQELGTYVYQANWSTQFELDATEQTEVILRILSYAGVVIRDPQIVQVAAANIQAEERNSKS